MLLRNSILTLLIFSFLSCIPHKLKREVSSSEDLVSQIEYLVNDPILANAQIGLYIESIKDNRIIFQQNENKLFVPASNQKLFTTAAALENLGREYRFRTEVYAFGEISDSTLKGDLVIRGMGDPSISGKFRDGDALAIFREWTDSLKAKGIVKISGDIIGKEGFFTDQKLGNGWMWDDESYYYAAQINALSYNDNVVEILLSPGDSIGATVRIQTEPHSDYITILNRAQTVHPDSLSNIKITRQRAKNVVEISGKLSLSSQQIKKTVTIENPAIWFLSTFCNVLNDKGIVTEGTSKSSPIPFSLKEIQNNSLLFTHYSPELVQIVKVINKKSNNLYAEQTLKTLGAEITKKGTAKAGASVVNRWLKKLGIIENQAIIVDGSGVSRYNLISPLATAAVLKYMYHSKNFNDYYGSLPIAGRDGTLENLMKNSVAEGVARAKTGTMTNVRCLAGYTTDQSGKDYVFIIMVNSFSVPVQYVKEFQAKICILLTAFDP